MTTPRVKIKMDRGTMRELALAARREKDQTARVNVGFDFLHLLHEEIQDNGMCTIALSNDRAILRALRPTLHGAEFEGLDVHTPPVQTHLADMMEAAYRLGWTAALIARGEEMEIVS